MTEIVEKKNGKIENFSSKLNNKTVYLLLVEDSSVTSKKRAFVGHVSSETAAYICLQGYETKWSDRTKIQSFDEAIEYANDYNANDRETKIEVKYPWCRVISVRNVTYKVK